MLILNARFTCTLVKKIGLRIRYTNQIHAHARRDSEFNACASASQIRPHVRLKISESFVRLYCDYAANAQKVHKYSDANVWCLLISVRLVLTNDLYSIKYNILHKAPGCLSGSRLTVHSSTFLSGTTHLSCVF